MNADDLKGKCWVAKHPNTPGYYAACCADVEYMKDATKDITRWKKDGSEVFLVSSQEARDGMCEYIRATRKP